MHVIWTTEQVLGLAPDKYSLKTSRSFASAERWVALNHNHQAVWGEFSIKDKPPYLTTVNLSPLALSCTCTTRKFPCNHSLSLLLLLVERPEAFLGAEPPEWVNTRWAAELTDVPSKSGLSEFTASSLQVRQIKRRQASIVAGLQDLDLWLRDMVRHGLAAVQNKPKSYWTQMADRLIDAQAGEVAREIRLMATIPGDGPDWPEQLLRKIGRLHLLIQGFKNFEALAPTTQVDLRAATGWFPKAEEVAFKTNVVDRWQVLGKQLVQEKKQQVLRTWLWGVEGNKPALITHLSYGRNSLDTSLVVGTMIEAELGYYPGAVPLRAHLVACNDVSQSQTYIKGYPSIKAATHAYAQAITANPWLPHFPMPLQAVVVQNSNKRWVLCDSEGYTLPLPKKFEHGWHLQALSRGGTLSLFGEWDGHHFQPLSLWQDKKVLELRILRGVN